MKTITCYDCLKIIEVKKRRKCSDGLFRCKKCGHKIQCKKYAESEKGQNNGKEYRKKNSKKICSRVQLWAKQNPDKRNKTRRKSRKNSPVTKISAKRLYYARQDYNKLRARIYQLNTRGWGVIAKEERPMIEEILSSNCVLCGTNENITIDHILPVSKNGSNIPSNLQPLCGSCNSFKGGRLLLIDGETLMVA